MLQPQQLPGPNTDLWDWQMHGLCRGADSSVFFHPDGERGRARAQQLRHLGHGCVFGLAALEAAFAADALAHVGDRHGGEHQPEGGHLGPEEQEDDGQGAHEVTSQ